MRADYVEGLVELAGDGQRVVGHVAADLFEVDRQILDHLLLLLQGLALSFQVGLTVLPDQELLLIFGFEPLKLEEINKKSLFTFAFDF